jgi:carboxypeptidase family protein
MIAAALALAASALAQAPARDAPPASGTAVVRGRVLADGATPRPLSRVEVHAIAAPLKINRGAMTDADGRYEIADLPAGRYTISLARANYVRASYGQRRPLGPGAPIDVANGQTVRLDDVVLQRSGAITGRILDEFGDPATGALVSPMRWAFGNGERRMQPFGSSATADDRGEYRLFGLAPGQYFISATMRRITAQSDTAAERSAYAPTYYPGSNNTAEAQRLTVAPGQTISGINMMLVPIGASRVAGTAVDANGRPLAGMNVFLYGQSGMQFQANTTVHADGTFTFGGVPPGSYTVMANTFGPDDSAMTEVAVNGSDVTDVQLVTVKASVVRGRVVFEPGEIKPPAASAIGISLMNANRSRSGRARDDRTFEINVPAGHATVRASAFGAEAWSIKRVVTADGADVIDAGVDIPANGSIDGIVVVMTSRQPELSGSVADDIGAKVRDSLVVLFAQDSALWKPPSRYIAVARPDQDGVFHVRVPPGDYFAAAFEGTDQSIPANDPDILQQLREHAMRFSVAEGEKRMLTVPLGPAPIY